MKGGPRWVSGKGRSRPERPVCCRQDLVPVMKTILERPMRKRKGGDPNNTDKRDPAPFSPDGSELNEGSVTQICAELRKQGPREHGLRHFLNAPGTLGVCWDTQQKARPTAQCPHCKPPQSPHRREPIDPILQIGKVRPTITELPRGCYGEAGLIVLYYSTHCLLMVGVSAHAHPSHSWE